MRAEVSIRLVADDGRELEGTVAVDPAAFAQSGRKPMDLLVGQVAIKLASMERNMACCSAR